MMITPKMVDDFMSVNIETVEVGKLADISMLEIGRASCRERV